MAMNDSHSDSIRILRLYGRLQRIDVVAFYLIFVGVFGGLAIGCVGLESSGLIAIGTGFSLLVALCVEAYLVLRFLKCPSCRDPFFMPKGWVGFLARINPHNRACVNCGMTIDSDDST